MFIIIYLDNIFIYTKDPAQLNIDTVYLVLEQLRRHDFFPYLKKCSFHQNEVQFLGFVLLA